MIDLTKEPEALTLLRYVSLKLPKFYELEPVIVEEALGISPKESEKIFAAYTVFLNEKAFEEFEIFQKIVVLFNSRYANYTLHQEIEIPEIAWAVKEMRQIDPLSPFSNEVLSYIAVCLYEEGYLKVPVELSLEKSSEGLDIAHFLEDLVPDDHTMNKEVAKIQDMKFKIVSHYVKERQAKLDREYKVVYSE